MGCWMTVNFQLIAILLIFPVGMCDVTLTEAPGPKKTRECRLCNEIVKLFENDLHLTNKDLIFDEDVTDEDIKLVHKYFKEALCKHETSYIVQCQQAAEKITQLIEEWLSKDANKTGDLITYVCENMLKSCGPMPVSLSGFGKGSFNYRDLCFRCKYRADSKRLRRRGVQSLCRPGHTPIAGVCVPDEDIEKEDTLTTTRYMTYVGLIIATGILLPKSACLGALVGIMVLTYIAAAEFYCMINHRDQEAILKGVDYLTSYLQSLFRE